VRRRRRRDICSFMRVRIQEFLRREERRGEELGCQVWASQID